MARLAAQLATPRSAGPAQLTPQIRQLLVLRRHPRTQRDLLALHGRHHPVVTGWPARAGSAVTRAGWSERNGTDNAVTPTTLSTIHLYKSCLRGSVHFQSLWSLISGHVEHLHHLVAKVIDDLHRNASGLRFVKRTRGRPFQCGPSILVNLCLQRCLKCLVGVFPT